MSLRLPTEAYHALVQSILKRDGWKCRSCGLRQNLHVHHIQYRSHSGPDESWNLITLCNQCHEAVHRDDLTPVQIGKNGDDGGAIDANMPMGFLRMNGWRPV
jgi:5-methylcytosine-specific restriction endonuclease McrA